MTAWILLVYAAGLLGLGVLASRRGEQSAREYYLAGRGLSTFVLFMALLGTNTSPFLLIGIPGLAYHGGLATFGVNAAIVALMLPITFWAIGIPARRIAREVGALSPAELYAKRLGSRAVGYLLFVLWTLYTLPYMATALQGAGVTLNAATDGRVPEVVGAVGVLVLSLSYTAIGGMRATAWTNVVQGIIFLGFILVALFFQVRGIGGGEGVSGALRRVAEERPELTTMPAAGLFEPRAFFSWSLTIGLCVIGFPHMLVRLLAASSEASLARICRLYPLGMLLLWLPAVLCGVFGALEFPGLVGKESDRVFTLMADQFLPPWLAGLAFLAVLAAVMSTLDAQLLTLGSMLSRDVLPADRDERTERLAGRLFASLVALATLAFWYFGGSAVFDLASIAFSGYVTLVPTLFLGLRWQRFSSTGAIASLVLGSVVLLIALQAAGGLTSTTRPAWFGFLPVFWGFLGAVFGAVGGSLIRPRAT